MEKEGIVTVNFHFTEDEMEKLNYSVKRTQECGAGNYTVQDEIKNLVAVALSESFYIFQDDYKE